MNNLKIIFVLILALLMTMGGCIPTVQTPADIEKTGPEVELGEGTSNINKEGAPQTDTFSISSGNFIMFAGKKITVKELNFRNELTLEVSGTTRVLTETKKREIINGLDITPLEFHFDPEGENTYIVLQVKEFVLQPNEYLMFVNQPIQIPNKGQVTLKDIQDEGSTGTTIRISVFYNKEQQEERILPGQTKDIINVKVTNVFAKARPIAYEKYAIVKIE